MPGRHACESAAVGSKLTTDDGNGSTKRSEPTPAAARNTQPNACCPLFQPNWFDKQMAETTACHFCHTVDNFFI
ncbi:hypothetical protein T4B_11644 [Trichinella pseudospiralis]|uniref:Uncharacterized protein n=2 Tax=Trichinella pseudospiralis TaxID=6337 RepID=A0A0V1E524_TRIPS|nr:hypothetical protein T4A_8076 [Trichinella pseudospiralis]KRY84417.1 hypothetical protein T4D_4016 [Trichinella pseudospiralis]KRZ27182.1 hypothetical protein T4B_11644 [Trichinella pseudospiralis]KRZ32513.1 hypothetical protein T4C_9296 [Trichinella pseudospiralis]